MSTPLRAALQFICLAWTALVAWPTLAVQDVRIGAAHFPPYTIRPEQGADTGLLPELVKELNRIQSDYRFVIVPTSIPRRFRDFEDGRVDMAIFENPEWGWENIRHVAVDLGLEDAEVFVARREGHDQQYFNDLTDKHLALFSGYHYAFAQFNASPEYLATHFKASLTYSHDSNLLMVLRKRADVALVTRSYLIDFMQRNQQEAQELLMSERVDQVYHHYALIRPAAPISGEEFSRYLAQLRDAGVMRQIFEPFRIALVAATNGAVIANKP